MSAQHTPGPWDFTQDGSTAKKLATVCVTGDGWIVGVPFSRETDVNYEQHGTSKADARLIAAAPELLAALQTIERGYGVTFQDAAVRNLVTDAIAKATGSAA